MCYVQVEAKKAVPKEVISNTNAAKQQQLAIHNLRKFPNVT